MSCATAYLRSVPIRRVKHPMEESPLWAVLGSLLMGTLSLAISLPLLIAFLLVLPITTALRWFLLVLYHRRHSYDSEMGPEPMRGSEARWITAAWQRSVVHAVLVLEGRDGLSLDNFRRILTARVLPVYPRLTRLPVSLPLSGGAHQCWLPDSEFSIARHVLPGPALLASRQALQTYVSNLLQDKLPDDKPPWEFHVISPKGDQKDTVVVVRVHQSIADGTTLLRVLCHSLADTPVMDAPERPQFGCLAFGLNVFRACLTGPCTLLIWLWLSASDCNPLTRRCAWTGAVTVTWSASITLPKVMRIKQVTRSTVNCVILSALAGALRLLLQGCGVRQPPNVKVLVPLDVRSQRTSNANSTALGNKSASAVVPLPVSVEGCVPRLWATRRTLSSLRSSADPVLLYTATAALMAVAPAATVCYLLDLLADKTSLQFSSLPGPTSQLSIGGERLKEMYCLLPAAAHVGISVTAITYADQVYISVVAEGALGPAAQLLLHHLEDQVEMMWKLLLNRRVPGEGRMTCFGFTRDMIDSPVREIEERLSVVQKEVVRLSEDPEVDQEGKLVQLKTEFAQLVGELKRRQSLGGKEKVEPENVTKTRRRAFSCSMPSRESTISIKSILSPKTGSGSNHVVVPDKKLAGNVTHRHAILHIEDEAKRSSKLKISPDKITPIELTSYHQNNFRIKENGTRTDHEFAPFLSKKHRKNSFEIMRNQNRRLEYSLVNRGTQSPVRISQDSSNSCSRGDSTEKTKDSEEDTGDTETDYSDTTIKISDDEGMELDYDDLKTSGPINTNLRDLYCSNYLEYKLQILRRKESKLSERIIERNHVFYPDIEDADKEGGLLI